jgi:hypothetical protein
MECPYPRKSWTLLGAKASFWWILNNKYKNIKINPLPIRKQNQKIINLKVEIQNQINTKIAIEKGKRRVRLIKKHTLFSVLSIRSSYVQTSYYK